ncbi:PqqD family protein [Sphingomonas sp.]|uniref:PqqD family protein n=1 Tax=Sphingomonas sp. TaxID=28214 RepID=UPI000BCE6C3E|nr:MAG: hypothetical protein B7Z07_01205 [Sphingomonadales bacterium 32-67-7]
MTHPAITATMKLIRNDKPIAVDMESETVMMDIDSGAYFALKGSGSYIWAMLERPMMLGEIVQTICDEFDVSESGNVEEAVSQFVGDLFAKGLVHEAE